MRRRDRRSEHDLVDPGHAEPRAASGARLSLTDPAVLGAARDADLGSRAAHAHALQGTAGNTAVQRLLTPSAATTFSVSASHREGTPSVRAGWSDDEEEATSGSEQGDESLGDTVSGIGESLLAQVAGLGDSVGAAVNWLSEPAGGPGDEATELGTGTAAGAVGTSSTTVGPPTNSTYAVSGDLDAVAATINARQEAGSVSTRIASQDLDIANQGAANERVVAARLVIAQAMELPVWTDKSAAPAKMQAEWDRFSAALAAHEAGHVQKDVAGFAGAHTKAIGKNAADADAAITAVETATTAANAAFDTATDHGRNAGTKLQTNLGQVIKVP